MQFFYAAQTKLQYVSVIYFKEFITAFFDAPYHLTNLSIVNLRLYTLHQDDDNNR